MNAANATLDLVLGCALVAFGGAMALVALCLAFIVGWQIGRFIWFVVGWLARAWPW